MYRHRYSLFHAIAYVLFARSDVVASPEVPTFTSL